MTCPQKVFGCQTPEVGKRRRFFKSSQRGGFTLLELLIVVVIFVVLTGLLLPAIARSKSRAHAIMCMNNSRQLALAWTMYSLGNNGRLAYNQAPITSLKMFAPPTAPNWVNNIMDWEATNPDNTNTDFIAQSVLSWEGSLSASIYHCPADHALSSVQKAAGWSGRVRSVSMNGLVGDPGSADGSNVNDPGYLQFVKEADFKDPSTIFVFLDEHPDSINDGYFLITPGTPAQWTDLPASYHNGGGSFSFADGHTEIHRWHNASTVRPPVAETLALPITLAPDDLEDFDWVLKHTSIPLK